MSTPRAEESPTPWHEIPGVALVGIVIGLVVVAAAIRWMFGNRKT